MRHFSILLLFLSCVIYVIQSSEPVPEPHPSSEPQPHAPEPHAPEPHPSSEPQPHAPEPHAPEPHPSSEPQPHAPEPHAPEPTPIPPPHSEPAPQPSSEPAPQPPTPTVDDFYIEELATAHNFEGVINGAVALTGNNDTITIFGGMNTNGTVPDCVLQYTISTGAFVNISYWNPALHVVSYSQVPPDPSNNYVQNSLYYLVENMTEYSVWSYDGSSFQKLFNVTFKMGETGQQIAATTVGVYVYDLSSGLWWWDGTNLVKQNGTGPEGRMWPALVTYNGDLFLQGGANGTKVYDDFWYYSMSTQTWSIRNNTGIPATWGHTATLSVLKTGNYNSANIYFTGLSTGTIVNYDINANSSSTIMGTKNLPSRSGATINGNRMFVYGGKVYNGVTSSNSLYQIVNEKYCTSSPDCETCVSLTGCTFCKTAVSTSAPPCVSGTSANPYILNTCANTNSSDSAVISMVEYCPEIFPSWAIALIVIGGVILVGGIVFGIMKLRSGKPGYEPV